MQDFRYHRPESLEPALELLAANPEAQVIAGGMTLIPTMKQRLASPEQLVDLGGIESLSTIHQGPNGHVSVGAMASHADVAENRYVLSRIPALAALAGGIGDPQVRNRGTIGGSIANNDPAADYPAALLALEAVVRTHRREIAAEAFFTGLFETALEPGELITQVEFPVPAQAGYAKFANRASRYAIVGVFVAKLANGIRVAVTGAGPSVFRATPIEEALARDFSAAAIDGIAYPPEGLNADMHASPEYRAQLIAVMARHAVGLALARAK